MHYFFLQLGVMINNCKIFSLILPRLFVVNRIEHKNEKISFMMNANRILIVLCCFLTLLLVISGDMTSN